MSDAKVLRQAVETQAEWMVRTLRALVEIESPSDDKAAVDAAVRLAAGLAEACGGRVKLHKQKHFGDVLEVRFGPVEPKPKAGSAARPSGHGLAAGNAEDDALARARTAAIYGPGVLDMKAGVAMALAAIRALEQLGVIAVRSRCC